METIDLSDDPRLGPLADLLRHVSGLDDPQEVQAAFGADMQRYNPFHGYVSLSVRGLEPGEYKVTGVSNMSAGGLKRKDPWKHWDDMPIRTGGLLGALIADDAPKLVLDLDTSQDPVLSAELPSMRSLAAIPLYDNGRALNWAIVLMDDPRGLDPEALEHTLMRGNLIGRMTKNLVDQRKLRTVLRQQDEELQRIAMIQQALLPERTPRPAGLDISTSYLTSQESGGDFFDFQDRADGWFAVLIADVAGHGAGAAVVVAMLQAILHTYPEDAEACPSCVLAYLNKHISHKRIENSFVTAFCALFSPDRTVMRYSNAGHNRPVLRRGAGGAGDVTLIEDAVSVPLGVLDDATYEAREVTLVGGDTIVFYTDGIVEAFGPAQEDGQRDMFGMRRLTESLVTCSGMPDCVVESVHSALYKHTRQRSRADDQTIVAVRLAGKPAGLRIDGSLEDAAASAMQESPA
jgi:sigma-B regulation protein RsbU (phosphoserine phosphatase)